MANNVLALLSALNGYGQGSLQRRYANRQHDQQQAERDQQQQQAQDNQAWQQQQAQAQMAQHQAEMQARLDWQNRQFAAQQTPRPPTFAEQMETMNTALKVGRTLPHSEQPGYYRAYNSGAAPSFILAVPGEQNGTRPRNFGGVSPAALRKLAMLQANPANTLPPGVQGPVAQFTSPTLGTRPASAYPTDPVPTYNPYYGQNPTPPPVSRRKSPLPYRTQPFPASATPLRRRPGTAMPGSVPPMPVRVVTDGQGRIMRGVTVPYAPPLPRPSPSTVAPYRPQGQPRRAGRSGSPPVRSSQGVFLHQGRPIAYTATPA